MEAAVDLANRRQKPRYRVVDSATVRLTLPSYGGDRRPLLVRLVDVSSTGLGVDSPIPLSVGVHVAFVTTFSHNEKRLQASGEAVVVSVRQTGPVYRIGLSCQNVNWAQA